jgi:hypothetical protein
MESGNPERPPQVRRSQHVGHSLVEGADSGKVSEIVRVESSGRLRGRF